MRGILGLIAVVIPIVGSAQTEEWVARYNGPGNAWDYAYALALDSAGNVYVTGISYDSGTYEDYATVKYNATGGEEWVARYNGLGNGWDEARAIAVDGSGNVYVTGISYDSGTSFDYATVKYNAAGAEQWVARYNGPGNDWDEAFAIAVDGSGNVYVTGGSKGSGTSGDYATVKYNATGGEDWGARYNGPGNSSDVAYAIAVDGSGNVYVTGRSKGSGTSSDYATVKYNASGTQQWVARYNEPGNGWDVATAIAVDGSGNVYVTGASWASGTNYFDYATVKYNASGTEQWVARYNGPDNRADVANAIAVDGSGNVYVTGLSEVSGFDSDYATVKYNAAGGEEWVARYNGPGNRADYAYALAVDGASNVYVTGGSYGSGTYWDYATVKYNASGAEQWVARYDGPGNGWDEAFAIAVDGSGNVYVTGRSVGSGTSSDYATIKYSSEGVAENQIPDIKRQILKVYPNPFSKTTVIRFSADGGQRSAVSLKIYNMAGRLVKTFNHLTNQPFNQITWDASAYPSGIYFVKLQAGTFTQTQKLILVR